MIGQPENGRGYTGSDSAALLASSLSPNSSGISGRISSPSSVSGGSSARLASCRSLRNCSVVAHSAGLPMLSRCPMISIQPRSCRVCMTFCDTVTPRMFSMSPRVTGCW